MNCWRPSEFWAGVREPVEFCGGTTDGEGEEPEHKGVAALESMLKSKDSKTRKRGQQIEEAWRAKKTEWAIRIKGLGGRRRVHDQVAWPITCEVLGDCISQRSVHSDG